MHTAVTNRIRLVWSKSTKRALKKGGPKDLPRLIQEEGYSPHEILMKCAALNMVESVEIVLKQFNADPNCCVPMFESETPLLQASQTGAAGATLLLLEHGADPNKTTQDASNIAPLWVAAQSGDLRVVSILLDGGADVNVANGAEHTPLYMACQNGHRFVAMELLRRGADPNLGRAPSSLGNPREDPLSIAIMMAKPDMVSMLINNGNSVIDPVAVGTLMQMEETKKICMTNKIKEVTSDVLQDIQDMVLLFPAFAPSSTYQCARQAERAGSYRQALALISQYQTEMFRTIGPPAVHLPTTPLKNSTTLSDHDFKMAPWTQSIHDLRRLQDAIYGIKHSDGRVSAWKQHIFEVEDFHPSQDLFYGWARHGDTIYRHGGRRFLDPFVRSIPMLLESAPHNPLDSSYFQSLLPTEEILFAFDLISRKWRSVKTKGSGPGPRSEHSVFVYNDNLFVVGGNGPNGPVATKLHRLDLSTLVWSAVATKGAKPGPRDETAVCVYKNKLYMHGGEDGRGGGGLLNQLWCLDLKSFKWSMVSDRHNTARKAHCIWAAKGKLYSYGGTTVFPPETDMKKAKSIRKFERFDLNSKEWEELWCAGDEPWPLSEYCCLPLYGTEEEPHAVVIFGGYREMDTESDTSGVDRSQWEAKYGEEATSYGLPYRKRMLRLVSSLLVIMFSLIPISQDIDTMVWTRLDTGNRVMPRAQCFAAEITTDGSLTTLVIGGGYGLTPRSESTLGNPDDEFLNNPFLRQLLGAEQLKKACGGMRPEFSYDLFQVSIPNGLGPCFIERARQGQGWEWDMYSEKDVPSLHCDLKIWSPTLYWINDMAEDDFREQPDGPVKADDESLCLGRRVLLHSLKGRSELNGNVGRCGLWIADSGRYAVTTSLRNKRETLAIKPSNLKFAEPVRQEELVDNRALRVGVVPLLCSCLRSETDQGSGCCQLDTPKLQRQEKCFMVNDTYYGPLSGQAMSVLDYCAERKDGHQTLVRLDPKMPNSNSPDVPKKAAQYERFVERLRATDKARVMRFENAVKTRRNVDTWSEYLKLSITLDGVSPTLEREVVVSSNVTIAELHHHILCPSIGWTSNFHAYALRRRLREDFPEQGSMTKSGEFSSSELGAHSLDILEKESWIGPNASTALDVMFQPLYIGGALADDRKILLGDLVFEQTTKGLDYDLQYVYDYGCWWSHTIRAEPSDAPGDGSVAVLESGKGHCPPEDSNGLGQYCQMLAKLKGLVTRDHMSLNPTAPEWWEIVNDELRGKTNIQGLHYPICFDLASRRAALKEALRSKLVKPGTEHRSFITSDRIGMMSTMDGPGSVKPKVKRTVKKASQRCALCGVTVGLRLCSKCKSVAFCCQEHLVEFWPQHKAECKAIQKGKES